MKRRVTDKQREANRRNAQKSTGPRTPEGKARSRENAVTHGLSATTCITKPLRYENPADFAEIRAKLFADCKPVGISEECTVEMIAAAFQRIKRCEAWETAFMDGALMAVQHCHNKPLEPTANDPLGCGVVLGKDVNEMTWEHLDRFRRAAWADYNRAQNQLRQQQKDRLERPVKEWKAFLAHEKYMERTHAPSIPAHVDPDTIEKPEPYRHTASFCQRCGTAVDELIDAPQTSPEPVEITPAPPQNPEEDLPKAA
jgi:hypothetical protein